MIVAKRPIVVEPGESLLYTFDFGELLASGETLTGAPLVTCTRAIGGKPTAAAIANLTITEKARNSTAVDDGEDGTVAANEGVQARIVGQIAGGDYLVRAECGTSGSNTLARVGWIQCRSE